MKRFVLILSTFLILSAFCSCDSFKPYNKDTEIDETSVTVNEPEESEISEYKSSSTEAISSSSPPSSTLGLGSSSQSSTASYKSSTQQFDGVYYANTNTKKFHKSTCGSAKIIKQDNLYSTSNRDELINSGYEPCLRCNP